MSSYQTIIIGVGFGGLCQAIKLREAGIEDFVILEKADQPGGTWRDNTYPGAECDIPSALYSYSFEHNPKWKHKWSHQDQILEYIHHCIDKYRIGSHIRYGQEVTAASYDESAGEWTVLTKDGHYWQSRSVIFAIGQLHHPKVPDMAGLGDFRGESWHSARWRHDIPLEGKRVGVVGNAASAVQIIPEIAPVVEQLYVYQRSANWMIPKVEPEGNKISLWAAGHIPGVHQLNRLSLWLKGGLMYLLMNPNNTWAHKIGRAYSLHHMRRHIKDPALRQKLTPDYTMGAKRILFSDHYYPALARENVELITERIDQIYEQGVQLVDGGRHELDVLIFATGFESNPFLKDINITGRQGHILSEDWADGAEAYLGMTVHGYPNLYMIYGPNTNLGHNSIIIMHEAQAQYITSCIDKSINEDCLIEVRKDVQRQYNNEMQQRLSMTSWSTVNDSWYQIAGKITNNWPGRTMEYTRRTKRVRWSDYDLT